MPWPQLQFVASIVGAIALVWTGLWWWSIRSARRNSRREHVPLSPWQKLCQVHRVSNVDAIRLNALCRTMGASDPLLLFVDPRLLEQAARGDQEPGEFARLGQQLFGEVFHPEAQG